MLHTLAMPGKKALLVISNGRSTITNGSLARTQAELSAAGVENVVYNGIQPNPTKENVEGGAKMAIANGCDFVVALGGGSVLDAAKVLAMFQAQLLAQIGEGGRTCDEVFASANLWQHAMSGTGGRKAPTAPSIPWIAIPTTAGTGSEVDAAGVITNLATNEKLGIFGSFALYAIVDPELQLSIPARFTAFQGFDALFHSLEGHICKNRNLYSDMIQREAITNIAQNLPIAYRDGSNLEARSRMAFASMLSGYSMVASTCTIEHSIEHALSAYHEQLPHGAGLIMISKAYFGTIIRQHVADDRFIEMARWLGKDDATRPEDFLEALTRLQQDCGVADLKMSDYGIQPAEFDAMAENALVVMERLSTQDIQPLTHDEIVSVLMESYK